MAMSSRVPKSKNRPLHPLGTNSTTTILSSPHSM
uniref:Uncharacterized protein n=1 Tax=Arundo donax TaxID=35708 RepID=A0A0A9A796_ARUDO